IARIVKALVFSVLSIRSLEFQILSFILGMAYLINGLRIT
ncbi:hypothetical protein Tco_0050768, partial [Tanacetum coccineum]